MTQQESTPQKDQSLTLEEQVVAKVNGIQLAITNNPDIFNRKSTQLQLADIRYPPKLILLSDSYEARGYIIGNLVKIAELDKSTLEKKTQRIDQLIFGLHPASDEIQKAQQFPEEAKSLYTRRDVIQDLRLTHFIMDEHVMEIWLSLNDENFAYFLDTIRQKQFPTCLTSDEEMKRLHADAYRFKVHPTYLPPDSPSEFSARDIFIDLCSGDEWGKIRHDVDIPSVFNALSLQYPQG